MKKKAQRIPDQRPEQILVAAIDLAKKNGYAKITRGDIAASANVSPALVSVYFGTMTAIRRTIMRQAIKREVLEIVSQGLADGNIYAAKAPDALKQKAVALLISP